MALVLNSPPEPINTTLHLQELNVIFTKEQILDFHVEQMLRPNTDVPISSHILQSEGIRITCPELYSAGALTFD